MFTPAQIEEMALTVNKDIRNEIDWMNSILFPGGIGDDRAVLLLANVLRIPNFALVKSVVANGGDRVLWTTDNNSAPPHGKNMVMIHNGHFEAIAPKHVSIFDDSQLLSFLNNVELSSLFVPTFALPWPSNHNVFEIFCFVVCFEQEDEPDTADVGDLGRVVDGLVELGTTSLADIRRSAETGVDAGIGASADSSAETGADTSEGASAKTGVDKSGEADVDASAETGAEAIADVSSDAGADASAETSSDAGAELPRTEALRGESSGWSGLLLDLKKNARALLHLCFPFRVLTKKTKMDGSVDGGDGVEEARVITFRSLGTMNDLFAAPSVDTGAGVGADTDAEAGAEHSNTETVSGEPGG